MCYYDPWNEGHEDFKAGQDVCPYKAGTSESRMWSDGWHYAAEERVDEIYGEE